jgi:hypothetical protein
MTTTVDAGLCATCERCRPITTQRGAVFLRCTADDDGYDLAQYPQLPVVDCIAYRPVSARPPRRAPSPPTPESSNH